MQKALILLSMLVALTTYSMHVDPHTSSETEQGIQKAIQYFEHRALYGNKQGENVNNSVPTWFKGDTEKTKHAVHSLLAIPNSLIESTSSLKDCFLLTAIRRGNVGSIKSHINSQADVNCHADKSITPLGLAIKQDVSCRLAMIELLLKSGARADAPLADSRTPLALAALFTHNRDPVAYAPIDVIKMLMRNGARMRISILGKYKGASPLSCFQEPYEKCIPIVDFMLTYVSREDLYPVLDCLASEKQVADDIIETRKLLLYLTQFKKKWKLDHDDPQNKALLDKLSWEKFEQNYGDIIRTNVNNVLHSGVVL